MKAQILAIAATLALSGCASTQKAPDWRDHVLPGPNGVNTAKATSNSSTDEESKAQALRFARQACDSEEKRLIVTDQETAYIGPSQSESALLSGLNIATAVYARNTGRAYTPPDGPIKWETTLTFSCSE